ncbi:SDR family NAD(P)-dependent oxidoreductase, partial [Streptomyces sp. NPDC058548]|uniref:type I polyketide synthase n=1 Tax=Streptomyces sp. NPDC058548 TaxID=3346545 RepID=UPI0036534904
EFGRQRGLAADGRCKAFAAAADGTGWGEGAGVLVLERLSDARRNGHQVLAVVRGSAVNQDGASNGLTAPNGPSQQRVIRQALAQAGLGTGDVDVVEAHGTGTKLGDPIEAQALLATYGQDRPEDRPLWLGSVKSNIGHTQAAAGVAGVIKMLMAMRHGQLPGTLHVDEPSPHVDWTAGEVRLLTDPVPWQAGDRPRRAGVSSFGVSGTNAHVILEEPPVVETAAEEPAGVAPLGDGLLPWVVSGRDAAGLRAQAAQLASFVRAQRATGAVDGHWLAGVAAGLAARAGLEQRAVVTGADIAALLSGLDAVGAGESSEGVVADAVVPGSDVVFVFPGQGGQSAGMGAELLECDAVFAAAIAECERALDPFVDWSLRAVLSGEERDWLDRVDVVQPVLWAVMVSLAEVWRAAGVVPDVVVGHSQGEIAAAVVAGRLSVEDGARVVALRSQALRELAGRGAMASIALDPAEAEAYLPSSVTVAAVNAPGQIVVSGPQDEVAALCARLDEQGIRARRIEVDYASHHAQVEVVEERLRAELAGVADLPGSGPEFVSTVTGAPVPVGELDAGYWYRNLREIVLFADVVRRLQDAGSQVFVEIGPHPVLSLAMEQMVSGGRVLHSLRRDQPETAQLLSSLGAAWTAGLPVGWRELLPAGAEPVALPTYAFQRQRYWLDAPPVVARTGTSETDAWRYRVGWTPLAGQHSGGLSRNWLLLCHDMSEVVYVRQALEGAGAQVEVQVLPDARDREHVAKLLAGAEHIAYLATASDRSHSDRSHSAVLNDLVTVMQAVVEQEDARLWVVTRGAVSAPGNSTVPDPVLAAVWGLGRVFGLEHPGHYGGLVDLPAVWRPATGGLLATALAQSVEDQLAVGADGVFVRRLRRAPAPLAKGGERWRPSGTVLVTGGTGGLGSYLARWLARNGAEHLVLVSRSGPEAPGAVELAEELTAAGTPTTVRACDITDAGQLAEVLGGTGHPPITTVIHAAGVSRDVVLTDLTAADLEDVLAAKVRGADALAERLADGAFERLVLFSSNAGVWGGARQGAYAAANAYLDALAERLRAAGRSVTSVAWGLWDAEGMGGGEAGSRLSRLGLRPMAPDRAVEALHEALGLDETLVAVADVDWEQFVPAFTMARRRPLIEDLPEARQITAAANRQDADADGDADGASALLSRLDGLDAAGRLDLLSELVCEEAARVLSHSSPDAIEPERAFRDMGFDSIASVELRKRLNAETGLRLPATVAFDHPTPRILAEHMGAELLGVAPDMPPSTRVFGDIDRLAGTLAEVAEDDAVRKRVAQRLRELLDACDSTPRDAEDMSAQLDSASDEEIFEFIDKRFKRS